MNVVIIGKHSYPITIAFNLFDDPTSFLPLKNSEKVMLVSNETIAPLYVNKVCRLLKMIDINVDSIILPDGERHKNLIVVNTIFTSLLQKLHGRNTTLIALGGGVIGDLTGFAAATYQRGVQFMQVPTTLLSQIDASIGGKTAVNHMLGKNMIGAFWHPISVVINLDCLKTLPFRELISGLAEVIKYAIIIDNMFFYWLEKNMNALLELDASAITYCVHRCCELKIGIITADERERGLRTLLNLGHTFGHAIEVEMGYGNWLHGEAVAVGIVMAACTSERLGQLKTEEKQRIITLLQNAGLPTRGPKKMSAQVYLSHMMRDKKILKSGAIRLVLPIKIGKSQIYDEVPYEVILNAINDSYN